MREKVKEFLQSDKVKKVSKKIFNKKVFIAGIIIVVLVSAARIGFSLAFEVEGTVSKIDGSNITVTNFFNTQTVNVGNYPIANIGIQVGDKIEISKNLSGEVYNIKDRSNKHIIMRNEKMNMKQGFKEGYKRR